MTPLQRAERLHDDLVMTRGTIYMTEQILLRAEAGLPLEGPLDVKWLSDRILACCQWRLSECPSCYAMAQVLVAEVER